MATEALGSGSLKLFRFQRVSGIEMPINDGRDYAIRYRADRRNIFLGQHTVDINYLGCATILLTEEYAQLRTRLNLISTVFLYVGRPWSKENKVPGTRFGLMQQQVQSNVGLLLPGDGSEDADFRQ